MPQKPVDELYTSLGYHKHGKTELVRTLLVTSRRAMATSSWLPETRAR
jgi:isocitrate dehydrogenase kinase/phosphatase